MTPPLQDEPRPVRSHHDDGQRAGPGPEAAVVSAEVDLAAALRALTQQDLPPDRAAAALHTASLAFAVAQRRSSLWARSWDWYEKWLEPAALGAACAVYLGWAVTTAFPHI